MIDTATKQIIAKPAVTAVGALAASPSGKFLYMSTGSAIAVLDTTQNAFSGWLPITGVTAIAFSPDGSKAYAASNTTLEVVDTSTGQVTGSFSLGASKASAVSVTPDGSQIWVALADSTSVAVIATQTGTLQTVDFGATVSGVAFGVH